MKVRLLVIAVGLALAAGWAGDVKPRRAPELPANQWLNTADNKPLRLEQLRGKVVLVEFWSYRCPNCDNVLPWVKQWHRNYSPQGLVIIGIHTPMSPPEHKLANVRKAVARQGIEFPVALDNDRDTWKRFGSSSWPTFYLIDAQGRIVYAHVGEGAYDVTEQKIQQLLGEAQAKSSPTP